MPRIPLLTGRQVGWFTRTLVFRTARRRYGDVPEPLRAAAHHPGLMWAGTVHELAVERAVGRLDPALRDIVVHRVATVVGCSWCVDFGTMLALRTGLSVHRHRELARYRESAAFSEREKLAIASSYYQQSGQVDKAIATFELYKQEYPRDDVQLEVRLLFIGAGFFVAGWLMARKK